MASSAGLAASVADNLSGGCERNSATSAFVGASTRRALTLALEGGQLGHEASAKWLLGEIAAGEGCLEQADGHYREALALAEKIGFRPMVAHCHRGLAKLHGRRGSGGRNSEHRAIATAMYREMDMQFYLQQVEAEKLQLP